MWNFTPILANIRERKLQSRIGFGKRARKWLFVIGVFFCVYPFASSSSNCTYLNTVELPDKEQVDALIQEAEEYNLFREKEYEDILNLTEDGMMGILEISKIELELPIYHGTEDAILKKGVGHICGSDFPVGGTSTHSLLAGHRGLLNTELFKRLNELEMGDEFSIRISGIKHTYQVCEISIIEPDDTSMLCVQDGRDLISLITCTPYGINTHRLVVTGERKENE